MQPALRALALHAGLWRLDHLRPLRLFGCDLLGSQRRDGGAQGLIGGELSTGKPAIAPRFLERLAAGLAAGVEFAKREEWAIGHVAARALIDATAGVMDRNPTWLIHTESHAIVFDRSNSDDIPVQLDISTVHKAPLARMDLSLRPITQRRQQP